jgi:uncharacterized RDD family membrane protein YckC
VTDSDRLAPPRPAGKPMPAHPPDNSDVLGLRVVAALIDLAILTVLLVALAATIGDFDPTGGTFHFEGDPVQLFAPVFLYYFGFEAVRGQTVGKLLVGLQVIGTDWRRPSAGHVAVRTVLRAVDGLPVLYLVGFVVMCATGKRRLRLGDLAAKTMVLRTAPIRHRGLVAVLLVLALVGGVALPFARLGKTSTTYRAHGVTFQYPAGWQDVTANVSEDLEGGPRWTAVLSIDDLNGAVVSAYPLPTPVSAENLDAVMTENTPYFRERFQSRGGSMGEAPEKVTVAGLPGLRYHGDFLTEDGTRLEATIVQAFDGATEYFFTCEHTRAMAAEIEQGCAQILTTFAVESGSEHEAAQA